MTTSDTEFRPHLARSKKSAPKLKRSFLNQVIQQATRAGPKFTGGHSKTVGGSGASAIGRRAAFGGGARRVIVKARIVTMRGPKSGGMGAVVAHLTYIERDGVTLNGTPGQMYDRTSDSAGRGTATKRCMQNCYFLFSTVFWLIPQRHKCGN